jgi:transposase
MDGYVDASSEGVAGGTEETAGRGRRRRSETERARIAAESLMPGVKVSEVARRNGVARWQVYDWRRKLAAGKLAVPVSAMSETAFAALVLEPAPAPPTCNPTGQIELVVEDVIIRVGANVDEDRLSAAIRAVRAAAG